MKTFPVLKTWTSEKKNKQTKRIGTPIRFFNFGKIKKLRKEKNMSNINICGCCREVWNQNSLKLIKLGRQRLYLCPDCFKEYESILYEAFKKGYNTDKNIDVKKTFTKWKSSNKNIKTQKDLTKNREVYFFFLNIDKNSRTTDKLMCDPSRKKNKKRSPTWNLHVHKKDSIVPIWYAIVIILYVIETVLTITNIIAIAARTCTYENIYLDFA